MDTISWMLIIIGCLSGMLFENQAFGSVCVICGVVCFLFGTVLAIL